MIIAMTTQHIASAMALGKIKDILKGAGYAQKKQAVYAAELRFARAVATAFCDRMRGYDVISKQFTGE